MAALPSDESTPAAAGPEAATPHACGVARPQSKGSVFEAVCYPGTPRAYTVRVGTDVLHQVPAAVSEFCPKAGQVVIITDSQVWGFWGDALTAAFAGAADAAKSAGKPVRAWMSAGSPPPVFQLPPGEASKTRESKEAMEDWMLQQSCTRAAVVVAFGGGVVGDLAGFAASTFMRGVPVVQVPTTLLAMVDSSIGGKTGLDTPGGKNLVGAFHQPSAVVADMAVLSTLPQRQVNNGMAEIIKAGAIADAALFRRCEELADAVARKDPEALGELVAAAAAVKCRVVTEDEREGGLRAILNFGHTVGHGIEAVMAPDWLHGECVAVGMVKEAEAARAMGACRDGGAAVSRLRSLLRAYSLPVRVPARARVDKVMRFMTNDKKNDSAAAAAAAEAPSGAADVPRWALDGEAAPPPPGAAPGFSWSAGDRLAPASVSIKCVLLEEVGSVRSPPFAHAVPHRLLARLCAQHVAVGIPPRPVEPAEPVSLRLPGSKSLSNRVLLLAGLAEGTTRVRGLLQSDDTEVMMAALETMGASLRWSGGDLLVTGTAGKPRLSAAASAAAGGDGDDAVPTLWVNNAGTAARFLTGALCLLPAREDGRPVARLDGNARMRLRPIAPLVHALAAAGSRVAHELPGSECPPLLFSGGGIPATTVRLAARLSSQYVSAVLIAAPCAAPAGGTLLLELDEEAPTSLPFIRMTLAVMRRFGAKVDELAANRYCVHAGTYRPPEQPDPTAAAAAAEDVADGFALIEPDASSASYPLALAAATGRPVRIEGVGSASEQGDAAFAEVLAKMGCRVERDEAATTVWPPAPQEGEGGLASWWGLRCPGEVDMGDITDTFLTAATLGPLCAPGPAPGQDRTAIVGVSNQRFKECDRIGALVRELAKCNAAAAELADGIEIAGRAPDASPGSPGVSGATVHCYDDHRVAMSFALLGAAAVTARRAVAAAAPSPAALAAESSSPAAAAFSPMVLDDPLCVEKTFPAFWDMLENDFGVPVIAAGPGTSVGAAATLAAPSRAGQAASRSVLIIGMRGAGKTTLARNLAGRLAGRWVAIDVDAEVQAAAGGRSVAEIVASAGWDGFRRLETEVLADVLAAHPTHAVISCGGGIVETEPARELLAAAGAPVTGGHVVLFLDRDAAAIADDLDVPLGEAPAPPATGSTDSLRPAYGGGESFAAVWRRRYPLFEQCATHTVVVDPAADHPASAPTAFDLGGGDDVSPADPRAALAEAALAVLRTAGLAVSPLAIPGVPEPALDGVLGELAGSLAPAPGPAAASPQQLAALAAAEPSLAQSLSDPALLALSPGTFFVSLTLPDLAGAGRLLLGPAVPGAGAGAGVGDGDAPAAVATPAADRAAIRAITAGSDAAELRVDLLAPFAGCPAGASASGVDPAWDPSSPVAAAATAAGSTFAVHPSSLEAAARRFAVCQLARVRRACPGLPVVWTVRSAAEGGRFAGSESAAAALLCAGVAAGAEFVDVERGFAPELVEAVFAAARGGGGGAGQGRCRVIVSRHWPDPATQPTPSELREAFAAGLAEDLDPSGRGADVVKLVTFARTAADVDSLRAACEPLAAAAGRPAILLAMGARGRASRVANSVLTPATSDLLPSAAAPGQLTVPELQRHRASLGLPLGAAAGPASFCLFGSPIRLSPSPAMHSTAFAAAALPHSYSLEDTEDVDAVARVVARPEFGGASVTIPLKELLAGPLLAALGPEAAAIGAVNTVAVREVAPVPGGASSRLLVGHNTDWIGIALPLAAALRRRGRVTLDAVAVGTGASTGAAADARESGGRSPAPAAPLALVIGAGGTARAAVFALRALGLRVQLWNRTADRARAVAEAAGASPLASLQDCAVPLACVVSTVPAAAKVELPPSLLASLPAVVEAAYIPRDTALTSQAAAAGCEVVYGLDMLAAQGAAQQRLWTGRQPAEARMAAAARAAYEAATANPAADRDGAASPPPGGDGAGEAAASAEALCRAGHLAAAEGARAQEVADGRGPDACAEDLVTAASEAITSADRAVVAAIRARSAHATALARIADDSRTDPATASQAAAALRRVTDATSAYSASGSAGSWSPLPPAAMAALQRVAAAATAEAVSSAGPTGRLPRVAHPGPPGCFAEEAGRLLCGGCGVASVPVASATAALAALRAGAADAAVVQLESSRHGADRDTLRALLGELARVGRVAGALEPRPRILAEMSVSTSPCICAHPGLDVDSLAMVADAAATVGSGGAALVERSGGVPAPAVVVHVFCAAADTVPALAALRALLGAGVPLQAHPTASGEEAAAAVAAAGPPPVAHASRMGASAGVSVAVAPPLSAERLGLRKIVNRLAGTGGIGRFALLRLQRPPQAVPGRVVAATGPRKTALLLGLRDRPGALVAALSILSRFGLSMTKIESFPADAEGLSGLASTSSAIQPVAASAADVFARGAGAGGVFRFFIELLGSEDSDAVQSAIKELQDLGSDVDVAGCYACEPPRAAQSADC
ncbi:hypothetical protein FNF31_06850 [Cafeteria roenbergensis]|uniref:Uncharacterized protein n=1 Tax=Cafeteria roenbergensis TaxID=33653 RepID=A0A5A8CFF8_CAFRO|nr:hypothetical protein FNF31_06850 [Cafeteria roenbergensis]KAA0165845.1 hypothetical protein FNF28_03351 [Cafeteria roenbergensis]